MIKHLNTKLIGILRTKPGTPKENAIKAIQTAFDAGAHAIEITSNSDYWQEVVKECVKRNLNIGVGSIKNETVAKEAINPGARFLVSPGFFTDAVLCAKENNIPILPGVYLEEELELAKKYEIKDIKFFPCSVTTDEEFFKAIREPFRDEFEELGEISNQQSAISNQQLKIIKSPTEFYKFYQTTKQKPSNVSIKLPDGNVGFEKLKTFSKKAAEYNIRTYAVGGINEKNIKEVLTKYNAYGVCPGSGMFNSDAIFNGDFKRVKEDVKKHVDLLKEVYVTMDSMPDKY